MNREFNPTSRRSRAAFALAAVLATVLIIGGIDGLATVYGSGGQLAAASVVQGGA